MAFAANHTCAFRIVSHQWSIMHEANISTRPKIVCDKGIFATGDIWITRQLDSLQAAAEDACLQTSLLPGLIRLVIQPNKVQLRVRCRWFVRLMNKYELEAMPAEISSPDSSPRFRLCRRVQLWVER